jgi:hypothetical protein
VSGQLHAPVALPPRERAADTHWVGGWVESLIRSEGCEVKILDLTGTRTPTRCQVLVLRPEWYGRVLEGEDQRLTRQPLGRGPVWRRRGGRQQMERRRTGTNEEAMRRGGDVADRERWMRP